MKKTIQNFLLSALQSMNVENAENFLHLEIPENAEYGDFATNAAMQLVKILKKNPRQIAEEILAYIPENKIIEKAEIAGPGFINFFVKADFVLEKFLQFSPEKRLENQNPKKICVEFSSPNVAKPLHVGHLRSTIIGDSIARILEFSGNEMVRENFLGDWGTGFGKLVVAMEKWGNMEKIKKNPIPELVELYKKFAVEAEENPILDDEAREAFRKLEMENDEKIRKEWKWIREVSIEQVENFYQFLDIKKFDWSFGESFYATFNEPTLKKIEEIGEISEGALVVKFLKGEGEEQEEKMPLILFRRADGATLYQTRDVSHLLYCEAQKIEEFITVVANEQSLHFAQIFDTFERLGGKMKCEHISFGMVLGADGKKFSTRRGNGIGLEEVFDEAKEKIWGIISDRVDDLTKEEKEKLVEDIAVGAIKFNDLSQNRITDIVFNWEKILSFEGFSGPFLQYSHARAKSILRKANEISSPPLEGCRRRGGCEETKTVHTLSQEFLLPSDCIQKTTPLHSGHPSKGGEFLELPLLKKMLEFSDVVKLAGDTRRPNILAEYLFHLSKCFNAFYQNTPILKADDEDLKIFRIFVVEKFAHTLKKGLDLLGIHAPEKM